MQNCVNDLHPAAREVNALAVDLVYGRAVQDGVDDCFYYSPDDVDARQILWVVELAIFSRVSSSRRLWSCSVPVVQPKGTPRHRRKMAARNLMSDTTKMVLVCG